MLFLEAIHIPRQDTPLISLLLGYMVDVKWDANNKNDETCFINAKTRETTRFGTDYWKSHKFNFSLFSVIMMFIILHFDSQVILIYLFFGSNIIYLAKNGEKMKQFNCLPRNWNERFSLFSTYFNQYLAYRSCNWQAKSGAACVMTLMNLEEEKKSYLDVWL